MKRIYGFEPIIAPEDMIVFMVGRPSSGKTTLMNQILLYVLNGVPVDKDTAINNPLITPDFSGREEVEGKLFSADESLDEYSRKNREREKAFLSLAENLKNGKRLPHNSEIYKLIRLTSYLVMQAQARDCLNAGKCPFMSAPHIKESTMGDTYFKQIPEMLVGRPLKTKLIVCTLPEKALYERMRMRNAEYDGYMSGWGAFKKDLEREPIIPPGVYDWDHLLINTENTSNTKEDIKRTLEFLLE